MEEDEDGDEDNDEDDDDEAIAAEKKEKKAGTAYFALIKDLSKYQQQTCASFLAENSSSFSLWCGKETLNKIVNKGRQHNISKSFVQTVVPKMSGEFLDTATNPPYLTSSTTLRDYQQEGISTLCSWYARGIGGILAGNRCGGCESRERGDKDANLTRPSSSPSPSPSHPHR